MAMIEDRICHLDSICAALNQTSLVIAQVALDSCIKALEDQATQSESYYMKHHSVTGQKR